MLQELARGAPVGRLDGPGHRELAHTVDTEKEIDLAFGRLNLGGDDVNESVGVAFELLPLRLVVLVVRRLSDPRPLQAAALASSASVRTV
ncbi:MAG: hypothetical protein RIG84_16635 [Roseovarius sp.]